MTPSADVLVTSFSPAGARLYGARMVASVLAHWPATTPLVVYVDAEMALPGGEQRRTADLATWVACRQRWASDPLTQGLSTAAVVRTKPYTYQWDAYRFAVKVFVWRDAALRLGHGILTWLDGDTVTHRRIPAGWTASLLGGADVAYLGRATKHPETGYVGFRVPEALPLLEWCCDTYSSDRFRTLRGWTDCHVLQAGLAALPELPARNLTATTTRPGRSHIWPYSPLASYVTHDKSRTRREQDRKRLAQPEVTC